MASQDGEISLEKSGETKESEGKICPLNEEKNIKDLIEALIDASDNLFEDDQKSVEWLIGTGWEEAVCGWGSVSSTACLYPQKKLKKMKEGESFNCIICVDMLQVTDSKNVALDTKTTTETYTKERSKSGQHGAGKVAHAEKDLPRRLTDKCSSPVVTTTQSYYEKVSSGEVFCHDDKQDKQEILESTKSAENDGGRLVPVIPVCSNCSVTKDSAVFGSSAVLPPLRVVVGNVQTDPLIQKSKTILMQQLEKFSSKSALGNVHSGQPMNTKELREEHRLVDALDHNSRDQRTPESSSFFKPSIPKTPLRDAERLLWHYSFLTQKPSTVLPSASSLKQNVNAAHMGFLHTRTLQNKRNMRQDIRHLNEAKLRDRASSGKPPFFTGPLLPSLTVTRVEIPVVPHRLL